MKLPTYAIKLPDSGNSINSLNYTIHNFLQKKYIDKTPYQQVFYLITILKINMKIEELTLINLNNKRCALCDVNLKGSTWRNISLALEYKDNFKSKTRHKIIQYYCVRCMTDGRKKHCKTTAELDTFVDNLISKRLKP